jgi:glutamate formiminotransferase / formiminotetrahydrofolate cyclodeaminase
MSAIVECVPNFSEGRNKSVIEAISNSIQQTKGCFLLDVYVGSTTNRTIYSFVGEPNDVLQGALNAVKVAYKLINMEEHKGEHPRIGFD